MARRQCFLQAVQTADAAYQAQFPAGANTLGFLGSGHNKVTGTQRIQTLTAAITAANAAVHGATRLQCIEQGPI